MSVTSKMVGADFRSAASQERHQVDSVLDQLEVLTADLQSSSSTYSPHSGHSAVSPAVVGRPHAKNLGGRFTDKRRLEKVDPNWRAESKLMWPDRSPLSASYNAGWAGDSLVVPGHDKQTVYLASRSDSILVGFRSDRASSCLREFNRINLGFSSGGISAVAAGGVWIYAAGDFDNRLVVLRLCHDWYQNRTRMLVMRVIDGGGCPKSVVTSPDGSLLSVLYQADASVRFYHCRMNGSLDLVAERKVRSTAQSIYWDNEPARLAVDHGSLGNSYIELESIFENIAELGNVRA